MRVPDVDRRERLRRSALAAVLAGHDAQRTAVVIEPHDGNVRGHQGLVGGRRVLVAGRKIHPELHHLQGAALFSERRRMEFLVHDAGPGRHPLHVAFADSTAATARIAMLEFAPVDQSYGLESAVRVRADAPRPARRGELRRAGMVQQQERTDVRGAHAIAGQKRSHGKAVTDPVTAGRAEDGVDLFHRSFSLPIDSATVASGTKDMHGTLDRVVSKT